MGHFPQLCQITRRSSIAFTFFFQEKEGTFAPPARDRSHLRPSQLVITNDI